jgi:hypothetical protein
MGHTITHFMWGYQSHFRISQKVHAKYLFQSLDRRFEPGVFLVGILVEDRQDRHRACVDPEDDFWIQSDAFNNTAQRAKTIVQTYPESRLLHSHPLAQKWHNESLFKRGVQDAISEAVAKCPARPKGMRYFPSFPVLLDGFLVSLIVGLQDDVIDSHASLSSDSAKIYDYRSLKVSVSLIDAVMAEYLRDVAGGLLKPDPGANPMAGKSPDEILRAAGNRMMAGAAQRADTFYNQEGHEELLFDVCNRISSLSYEGAASAGHLVVARKNHPAVKTRVAFARSVEVHNVRASRKLLELTSPNLAIHMNAKNIFGLVEVADYTAGQADLYEVNILGHHLWELAHAGKALMRVRDGLPSLPAPPLEEGKVRTDLRRVFRNITIEQVDLLVSLVSEAVGEKHGTMLVISEDAANEALRLANQGTLLEPCLMTPELLRQLTRIDGAVLLDPTGTCYAIGVILDGLATEKGNPARGARFNSAVRYVGTPKKACMAIVVSEDGGVDLVPDLRPPIRRSEIEQRLAEIEGMLKTQHIPRSQYHELTDWLREHRFYLLKEHCDRLNELVDAVETLFRMEDPEAPQIIWGKFVPDDEMDESLYYLQE